MSSSIIRVSRRSRRFNCRPRPACLCPSASASCFLPSAVAGQDQSPEVSFTVASGLLLTGGSSPLSDVKLLSQGVYFDCESVGVASNLIVFQFSGVIDAEATVLVPEGWDRVTLDGAFLCGGGYPVLVL